MNSAKKYQNNGKKSSEPNGDATPKLQKVVLRLYVTGQTPRSVRAIENLSKFCRRFLKERFDLEVIDIYQEPSLAKEVQIVAAPTLIKSLPLPVRRLVGDFSDQERVISGLDIEAA
jgi:circadian clock protein KaiB